MTVLYGEYYDLCNAIMLMSFVPGAVSYTGSHYDSVLNLIRGMIEGTVDVFVFEGELHKVLDSGACMAYTVEKILQNIVRQVSTQSLSLFWRIAHVLLMTDVHRAIYIFPVFSKTPFC